jgi:hypothetical protein
MTMMARRIPAEPGPPVRIGRSFACVSFVSAYRGTASLASVVFGLMMGRGQWSSRAGGSFSISLRLAGLAGIGIWFILTFPLSFNIEHYRETGSRQDTPITVTSYDTDSSAHTNLSAGRSPFSFTSASLLPDGAHSSYPTIFDHDCRLRLLLVPIMECSFRVSLQPWGRFQSPVSRTGRHLSTQS